MNTQTIAMTIPVELRDEVKKIVANAQKYVNGVELEIGNQYRSTFNFPVIVYDWDGHPHGSNEKRTFDCCDIKITIPAVNEWRLKCSYHDGLATVTDLKKELEIKNPSHGSDYYKCDCCKHNTVRHSFLIENTKTGEELQVGKECLKKYHLETFSKIDKMTRELLDLYDEGYDPFSESSDDEWGYKDINTGKQSILVREMIRSARAFYIDRNGEWIGAYWDGRTYYKSPSGIALQEFTWNPVNFSHIPDEYVDKVLNFVKVNIGEKLAKADIDDYEFERDMLDSLSNVYMPLCFCHYAFFAVKKYEQYMERERQRLEMERLGKLEVGQQLHVRGEVISHKTYEGYFGKYDVYEVRTEKGYTLRRKGVIPVSEDKKTTEFYSKVLGISSNGVVSLDRATKNPKKGVQYTTI